MYDKCYFCLDQLPKLKNKIHSKLFRKFWRSRGTKEPAYITVFVYLYIYLLSNISRLLLIWWRKRWRRASPRKRYFLIVHEPLVYIEIVQFQEKRLLPLSNSTQWSQINEYRETFNRFDADGNGSIDAEELGKLIRVLGWVGIYFQIIYITCSIGNCYNSNLCSIGPVFVLGWVDISIHLT